MQENSPPFYFRLLSLSLSTGELKTWRIPMPQVICISLFKNNCGRIQKLFACVEGQKKIQGKNNPVQSIYDLIDPEGHNLMIEHYEKI